MSEEVAAARGIPTRLIGLAFTLSLAVAVGLTAIAIGFAPPVDQRRQAARSDRNVDDSLPPGPPEAVGDKDGGRLRPIRTQRSTQSLCRYISIGG